MNSTCLTLAGLQHFGRPTEMEREMFTAFEEGRRLDHEESVVIERAGGSQEGTCVQEAIRTHESETLDVERFGLASIGHEVHDV